MPCISSTMGGPPIAATAPNTPDRKPAPNSDERLTGRRSLNSVTTTANSTMLAIITSSVAMGATNNSQTPSRVPGTLPTNAMEISVMATSRR